MSETLASMRAKYEALYELRTRVVDAPRERMRKIAARWPGALRELDQLPLEELQARRAALSGGGLPNWVVQMASFHGWMRAGLELKRRFGRDEEAARRWIASAYAPGVDEPSAPALAAALGSILRPPGGRLSGWVIDHLAVEQGLAAIDLETTFFGRAPHRPR